MNFCMEEFRSK